MEIDMPEWFDQSIGWFFNWGMSSDYFPVPNIWIVVVALFIFLLIAGVVRMRNIGKREAELAKAPAKRESHPLRQFDVPGDEA
ncbi:MAG: hypothetical protein JWM07_333 [Candidatus Saccharibacteria bacterium]|jgi:hypothetical protein|nr:hypothetical protein [Candidatus Saccharibacteria bacterium]